MKSNNRTLLLLIALMCFFLSGTPSSVNAKQAGTIVINEFLAANNSSLLDPDYSQYADWIEVCNKGASAADMGGLYLTDDLSNPKKWQIPAGTLVQSGHCLLFWADGMDDNGNGLHTNFKLNKGGEAVGLYDKDGSAIDTLTYGNQITDVSYGRSSTGSSIWLYFSEPTPGADNITPGLEKKNQSAPPVFSLPSGFYSGSKSIILTAPSGGTIRYTLDGSNPTGQSAEYKSPLSISTTSFLKARVYEQDQLPGPVLARSYFINEQTTLPVVSLFADPADLWSDEKGIYNNNDIEQRRYWERPAHIEFFENTGRFGFETDADIRLFGNTAIFIPEKCLSLFLPNTLDYPLFGENGVQQFTSFILRSSSDDWHRTMFRDAFIQTMIRQNMNIDTQNYRPSILFINGEYWGIHNIREKLNEDYLAVHHGVDPKNVDMLFVDERPQGGVDVLEGDAAAYNSLIDFVENNNFSSQANYDRLAALVDIDNFTDYVIAEGFTGNSSWAHNIRMWRTRSDGGKWRWLVFDMDRGFRDQAYNSLQEMSTMLPVFQALLQNQNFRQRFALRFAEYLNGGFRPERVTAILDSLQAGIAAEIPRHSERWKDECGNGVCGIPSYDAWLQNVASMRAIVQERPGIVQQQMIDLLDLTGMVRSDIQVTGFGYGHVKLGEITSISQNYQGTFFKNTTLDLTAVAHGGYHFTGWQETSTAVQTLLSAGSVWKYFDGGFLPDEAWYSINYNDSSWKSGPAQLGYDEGDENTRVSYGPDPDNKYITTYFRTSFQVADVTKIQNLTCRLLRDDGAVVYLNGRLWFPSNMPEGPIGYDTLAGSSVTGNDENTFFEYSLTPEYLVTGTNILAVEIHQYDKTSSDISFDLELDGFLIENGGNTFISTDPGLALLLDQNRAVTAVFAVNAQNQLPAVITQNLTLTNANSPYIAMADVTVPPNVTLTLEPGAEIQLATSASIYINGRLLANGSKSMPVVFRGIGSNGRWGAICFENATAPSLLSWVKINGATTGTDAAHFKAAVSAYYSDLTLDQVNIQNVGQPFYAGHGSIVLKNCSFDGTGASDDITNIQYASALIENCYLFGNGELDFDTVDNGIIRNTRIDIIATDPNRDGIDIGASKNVLIENNRVSNCPDKGISVGEASTTIIRGNLVVNTNMAVAVKDNSTAQIYNNTFYEDSVGVACYEKVAGLGGGFAKVSNTIFAHSRVAEFSLDSKSTIQIDYSLSDRSLLSGTGNIMGDPRFQAVNEDNFYLHANSPCIDAGDPASPKDPDNTRSDMGAFFYNKGTADYSNILINEFMASNTRTLADNASRYDDWIEIYNKGDFPVNLAGLYMTDDFDVPGRWQIPSGYPDTTTVQPGHFLVIWADAELNEGVLHADFKLSAGGDQIGLLKLAQNGVVYVDSIRFGKQADDVSYGRVLDGGSTWKSFSIPTPGYSNNSLDVPPAEDGLSLPKSFAVAQNYPNPFNASTTIVFDLARSGKVTVDVFDVMGRRIARLMQEEKQTGQYQIKWLGMGDDGFAAASGIYFYKVTAGELSSVRKMALVR